MGLFLGRIGVDAHARRLARGHAAQSPARPTPSSARLVGSGTPWTGMVPVATSRISWSLVAGLAPATLTKMSVGPKVNPPATGRKSAALAGSTLTPVILTPEEKVNPKPVKTSEHGVVVTVQNGIGGDARLVIVIVVSPTSTVDKSIAPSMKWTGIVA